ncbi:MAG: twin-arginine translocase subunit TatC [Synergistaceae bacterium]|jgi:sec-independent protein translocase protein TatC|nr:twin-arginine translocase subunit TatC [Synergistaceae bacterium]
MSGARTSEKANGKMPLGGESGWEDHLDELRRRVIAVLVVFSASALAAFVFSDNLAAFLMSPVSGLGVKLYTFAPAEKFTAYLRLSVWTGVLMSLPFALLQIGAFVWPALIGNERRYAAAALLLIPLLFISGSALTYKFLAPVVLKFFLSFGASDAVQQLWGFSEYLSMLAALMIASGLLLETPLVLLASFALGILTPKRVSRFRPHIIVALFLIAGICTPPDVISQIALGVPLYLLFELTLLIGRLIVPN